MPHTPNAVQPNGQTRHFQCHMQPNAVQLNSQTRHCRCHTRSNAAQSNGWMRQGSTVSLNPLRAQHREFKSRPGTKRYMCAPFRSRCCMQGEHNSEAAQLHARCKMHSGTQLLHAGGHNSEAAQSHGLTPEQRNNVSKEGRCGAR
eukprot:scaffold79157_cov20-Tisochrysis_lutea.AAC.3